MSEVIAEIASPVFDVQVGNGIATSREEMTEIIDEWLEEHPEATTTVEDGSLTSAKFSDILKLYTIKDYVTPEMYGAVGDGATDDTAAVAAAIASGKTVVFTGGKHLISNTISVSLNTKIYILKQTTIVSDVSNGPAFYFNSEGEKLPKDDTTVDNVVKDMQSRQNGSYIDGVAELTFVRTNIFADVNGSNESIAIEIGDRESGPNKLNCSFGDFANIGIFGFKYGIKINWNNVYLITLKNIHFENNNTGIITSSSYSNSGENMQIDHCVFGHAYKPINLLNGSCGQITFNKCSFDFTSSIVNISVTGLYNINFNDCHVEGLGYKYDIFSDAKSLESYGTILYNGSDNQYNSVFVRYVGGDIDINPVHATEDRGEPGILFKSVISKTVSLILDCIFVGSTNIGALTENVTVLRFNMNTCENVKYIDFFPYSDDDLGSFYGISAGSSVASSVLESHGLKIKYGSTNNKLDDGSLEISNTSSRFIEIDKIIYKNGNSQLYFHIKFKPNKDYIKYETHIDQYDKNGNKVTGTFWMDSTVTESEGVYDSKIAKLQLARQTEYCDINIQFVFDEGVVGDVTFNSIDAICY